MKFLLEMMSNVMQSMSLAMSGSFRGASLAVLRAFMTASNITPAKGQRTVNLLLNELKHDEKLNGVQDVDENSQPPS